MLINFVKKNWGYLVAPFICLIIVICNSIPSVARFLIPINAFYIKIIGGFFSLFPNSVFGLLVVTIIPILILVVFLFIKSKKKVKFILKTICVLSILLCCFYLCFGFSYNNVSVYDSLNLDLSNASKINQLCYALDYFITQTNYYSNKISFDNKQSQLDSTFIQLDQLIQNQYHTDASLTFLFDNNIKAKQFVPSFYFNYQGITGMFFPIFAEVNVCENLPNRVIPFTLAHELAHSKGVTNEGEANFIAFVVCSKVDNDYVRYSAYSNATIYLLNQLYRVDDSQEKTLYQSFNDKLNANVKSDFLYANEFYSHYDGVISNVSDFFNNLYLQSNGIPEGVKSYSKVVNGLIAYYLQNLAQS